MLDEVRRVKVNLDVVLVVVVLVRLISPREIWMLSLTSWLRDTHHPHSEWEMCNKELCQIRERRRRRSVGQWCVEHNDWRDRRSRSLFEGFDRDCVDPSSLDAFVSKLPHTPNVRQEDVKFCSSCRSVRRREILLDHRERSILLVREDLSRIETIENEESLERDQFHRLSNRMTTVEQKWIEQGMFDVRIPSDPFRFDCETTRVVYQSKEWAMATKQKREDEKDTRSTKRLALFHIESNRTTKTRGSCTNTNTNTRLRRKREEKDNYKG